MGKIILQKHINNLKEMVKTRDENIKKTDYYFAQNKKSRTGNGYQDDRVLANHLTNAKKGVQSLLDKLNVKKMKIKTLLDSRNHLMNIKGMYNVNKNKMSDELYNINKKASVNKRLIEFYSKDYDLKSILRRYLKYIYFILVGILVLILIYKKLHKNKKIVAFLVVLILFPLYFVRIIFDLVIDKVGHFKLDVLYTFFIFIIIGIGVLLFSVIKKIMVMITTTVPAVPSTEKMMPSTKKMMPSTEKMMPSTKKMMPSTKKISSEMLKK
jgi:hypothetical protein